MNPETNKNYSLSPKRNIKHSNPSSLPLLKSSVCPIRSCQNYYGVGEIDFSNFLLNYVAQPSPAQVLQSYTPAQTRPDHTSPAHVLQYAR